MRYKFVFNKNGIFTSTDKKILINSYQNYFAKIYGNDLVDLFLHVANLDHKYLKNREILEKYSDNYKIIEEMFKTIETDKLTELLCIYDKEYNLVAMGRLIQKNRREIYLKELIFNEEYQDNYRDLWVNFIKDLQIKLARRGYHKLYLEIPFYEGPLLIRANELGYKEDIDNIVEKVYIVNKKIGK